MNCIKKIAYVCVLLLITTGAAWGMDIFEATRKGNIGRIEELLASGADVNQQDSWGNTPLHCASAGRRRKVVALRLIEAGARVNQQNNYGETPLHIAAFWGFEVLALRLIQAGADVNQANNRGETALHWATRNGGHEKAIRVLIQAGADINQQDNRGETALHEAASNSSEAVVARLIEAGADMNRTTSLGQTAVDLATERRQLTIVALLNDYIQRIDQARQRVPVIAHILAQATHHRLGAASPLALLPQELMRHITHLVAEAEEVDARRPRQAV